ncbi:histone-lysine n-methyltransferase atxr3 [Hordeum vulgare]|nr:histone-lysine n-methyltransferase atxr3 [Hordeum vulgare]
MAADAVNPTARSSARGLQRQERVPLPGSKPQLEEFQPPPRAIAFCLLRVLTGYAADSILWDTWLRDEQDVRRASYFVGTVAGPQRAREVRGRIWVRSLTPTPSPSPPPPSCMTEEEARLIQRVMEDYMATHDERQWQGLDRAMALSAAGDVTIPELMEEEEVAAFPPELVDASWGWSCTAPEMARAVGAVNWCPTPPRSLEREASPREEVLHASFQHAPAHQGPSAHLWTPPSYVDLVSGDTGDQ